MSMNIIFVGLESLHELKKTKETNTLAIEHFMMTLSLLDLATARTKVGLLTVVSCDSSSAAPLSIRENDRQIHKILYTLTPNTKQNTNTKIHFVQLQPRFHHHL